MPTTLQPLAEIADENERHEERRRRWQEYERRKARIQFTAKDHVDFERQIKAIMEELGI